MKTMTVCQFYVHLEVLKHKLEKGMRRFFFMSFCLTQNTIERGHLDAVTVLDFISRSLEIEKKLVKQTMRKGSMPLMTRGGAQPVKVHTQFKREPINAGLTFMVIYSCFCACFCTPDFHTQRREREREGE